MQRGRVGGILAVGQVGKSPVHNSQGRRNAFVFDPPTPLTIPVVAAPLSIEKPDSFEQFVAQRLVEKGWATRWAPLEKLVNNAIASRIVFPDSLKVDLNIKQEIRELEGYRLTEELRIQNPSLLWVEAETQYILVGPALLELESKHLGLGQYVLNTLYTHGSDTLDILGPRQFLDLASNQYWMGESDDKLAAKENGEDAWVKLKDFKEYYPQWALDWKDCTIPPRPSRGTPRTIWELCFEMNHRKRSESNDAYYIDERSYITAGWCLNWTENAVLEQRIYDDMYECACNNGDHTINWARGFHGDPMPALEELEDIARITRDINQLLTLLT